MRCSPPTGRWHSIISATNAKAAVCAGGVAFNDVVMQVSSRRLPFGGVGASGMGRYHGEASFECFSNCRSYFLGSKRFDLPLRYAPYPKRLLGWLRRLMD